MCWSTGCWAFFTGFTGRFAPPSVSAVTTSAAEIARERIVILRSKGCNRSSSRDSALEIRRFAVFLDDEAAVAIHTRSNLVRDDQVAALVLVHGARVNLQGPR